MVKKIFSSFGSLFNKRFTFPLEGRFSLALSAFSKNERRIFFGAVGVFVVTSIVLLLQVNETFMVRVPAPGGTVTEGVLNTPAHINPLLASSEIGSEADRDLTMLIYSGLLRADGQGNLVNDLADHYTISDDGLTYTFILKKDLVWHDGKKITADDVIFTIKTAQDSRTKSPKRANWDGVTVERVDDLTVKFSIKKPYAPFLENATLGILPEHIWKTIDFNRFETSKYNREPIGSGPYKLRSIQTTTKDGDEIPTSYTLTSFKNFALGEPHIKTIKIIFYHNEDELLAALKGSYVGSVNSISPVRAKELVAKGYRVEHTPLPRVLAVFLNQSQAPIFADSSVRSALALTVEKQEIINKTLAGYGVPLDAPLPPGSLGYEPAAPEAPRAERLEKASSTLSKAGWVFNATNHIWEKKTKKETLALRFDLATSEAPELKLVAQELKTHWEELGAVVNTYVFPTGDLKETIVRPRKFDALFFGNVVGRDGDPYPFWHSSQRLDPGLNVASYVNPTVDKLLETARTETDQSKRIASYQSFKKEIQKDIPGIFLYAPEFLYVIPKDVQGFSMGSVTVPAERFLNVHKWYINTEKVWRMFAS